MRARKHGTTIAAAAVALALGATLGSDLGSDVLAADARATGAAVNEPMREHADDVASYTLRASLDPAAHTVHGEGTIRWTNAAKKPVRELWLHLYLNAFKNQSSVWLRTPVGGFRGSTVPHDWGTIDLKKLVLVDGSQRYDLLTLLEKTRAGDEDETDARVTLPREVPPGSAIDLEVEWDDKLPSVVERTGFDGSFHMVAQWFPKIAKVEPDGTFAHFPFHHLGEFYADFGTYDVTLDVPEKYVVGATGKTVEMRTENGRRIERHVQSDIHDFAWTAWDHFQSKKERVGDVDVTVLYPPGFDDQGERELDTMRFALPHYGEMYGRYPYPVLTVVHPPATATEAGGMEYPTLITTGGSWLVPRGIYPPEIVTVHEFGHQYFYGLIASNEVLWPFLDEGLNSWAETEAMEAWKGPANAVDRFGLSIGLAAIHSAGARRVGQDEKIAQPAYAFATGRAYGSLVYSRTATILDTLRRVFGDDAMKRTMGVYARRYRFAHPVPDDLIAVFRAEMGDVAAEALRVALFDKGWIDVTVTSATSHEARSAAGIFDRDGKRETLKANPDAKRFEGYVLLTRRGTLHLPMDVEMVFEDGSRTRAHWDGQTDTKRIPWSGASPLRAAVVDPDRHITLDENPENNFAQVFGSSGGGAPRTLERSTFWLEAILGAIAP